MFYPVSRRTYRWETPDPEDDWMMVGHLVLDGDQVALIDPPLVPHLCDAMQNLGKPVGVILTTADHVRASRYFSLHLSLDVYVPEQVQTTNFNPQEVLDHAEIGNLIKYREGEKLPCGLRAFRAKPYVVRDRPRYDEMALLAEAGELLVGDIASGTCDGRVRVGPEMFNPDPPMEEVSSCFSAIADIVRKTGAQTLLSSHWYDIEMSLGDAVKEKEKELPFPR